MNDVSCDDVSMNRADHWEKVYRTLAPDRVSWYQEDPALSFRLIGQAAHGPDTPIIDVGGGASRLVDRLVEAGYRNLTVMDLSPIALSYPRERLGTRAGTVTWIEGDVLTHRPGTGYGVWHDRAVFHFLIERTDRLAYVRTMTEAVTTGGSVIVAAFSPRGPETCSGLPVVRYTPAGLAAEFGDAFVLTAYEEETHPTPGGAQQHFGYTVFRRI